MIKSNKVFIIKHESNDQKKSNEEFWEGIYDWIVEWFNMYKNAGFTLKALHKTFTKPMLDRGDDIPTYEQFENHFNDWIRNYRKFEFSKQYFINTNFGWVLTSKFWLIMESINYLENEIKRLKIMNNQPGNSKC